MSATLYHDLSDFVDVLIKKRRWDDVGALRNLLRPYDVLHVECKECEAKL